jgi:hypothetical protein
MNHSNQKVYLFHIAHLRSTAARISSLVAEAAEFRRRRDSQRQGACAQRATTPDV